MKIYIAGKITGLDGEAAESNFMWAEMLIEKAGHEPLNPMKLVDQAPGRTYGEYLADALRILLTQAEAIYFLNGWTESNGAQIEQSIAMILNMPIYSAMRGLPENLATNDTNE